MAAKADINKIKKIKKRRRKKEHFPGMWLKTENIQLFKKYPLFFFFFYRYSYLYLNVNRSGGDSSFPLLSKEENLFTMACLPVMFLFLY